ncbi:MAG: O-antigen ligase family protein [Granulosicoccaceae bacterium]
MEASNYNNAASPITSVLLGAVICSAILLATLPGGNLINIGISGLFVVFVLFNAVAGKRALWFSPEILILVAWLSFSMIGTLTAIDTETAMFKSLTMLQVMILAFCIQQVIIWNQGNSSNLIVYGVAVSLSYLLTFTGISAQEVAGAEDVAGDVNRVASTLNDENTFGAVALMGFSFCLIALAKNKNKVAVLPLGLLLMLLFMAVVNSGSRTAFLGGVLLLLGSIWGFSLWRGAQLGKFLMYGAIAVVAGGAIFLGAKSIPEVEDRIEAVFSSDSQIISRVEGFIDVLLSGDTKAEEGESIDSRVSMINDGIEVVSNNPFVGVGLDNFRTVTGAGTYAHSNLIEVGASTGLVGLLIYYAMYAVLTLRIFRLMRIKGVDASVAKLALVGLMAYFLMDITRVSYYEKTSWIYFAMLAALIETHLRAAKMQQQAFDIPQMSKSGRKRRRRKKAYKPGSSIDTLVDDNNDLDQLFEQDGSTAVK